MQSGDKQWTKGPVHAVLASRNTYRRRFVRRGRARAARAAVGRTAGRRRGRAGAVAAAENARVAGSSSIVARRAALAAGRKRRARLRGGSGLAGANAVQLRRKRWPLDAVRRRSRTVACP